MEIYFSGNQNQNKTISIRENYIVYEMAAILSQPQLNMFKVHFSSV